MICFERRPRLAGFGMHTPPPRKLVAMIPAPVAQERNSRNAVARLRSIERDRYGESMMADEKNDQGKDTTMAFLETAIDYGQKLVEFGFMNTAAAFDGARKLAGVKSPQEFFQALTDLTREQFERLSEQIEELCAPMTPRSNSEKTGTGFWD